MAEYCKHCGKIMSGSENDKERYWGECDSCGSARLTNEMVRITVNEIDIVSDNERLIPGKQGQLVLNPKYRKCKEDLINLIRSKIPEGWGGPLEKGVPIVIEVRTNKDLTNLVKIVADSMQGAKLIKNDRIIDDLHLMKRPKIGPYDSVDIHLYLR